VLNKFNIKTKKEWRKWLLNNHPDKGGNTQDCQDVIRAGKAMGW